MGFKRFMPQRGHYTGLTVLCLRMLQGPRLHRPAWATLGPSVPLQQHRCACLLAVVSVLATQACAYLVVWLLTCLVLGLAAGTGVHVYVLDTGNWLCATDRPASCPYHTSAPALFFLFFTR